MKQKFKDGAWFFIPYLVFAIVMLILILTHEKGELHLMLSSHHTTYNDIIFRYITYIGGGLSVVVGVGYVFYKYGAALYILVVQLVNLLLTNGLKLLFGVPRPKTFFEENFPDVVLHQVDRVQLYLSNGFPSGHTSSAFAMMLCIALISKNKYVSLLCCLVAILVGYSRIYLSQHFAEDVLFGSFVGVVVAAVFYPIYLKLSEKYGWMNQSVVDVRRNNF